MVMLAAVNRRFSKLDLCTCLCRYGCPWRPEEGGCEWHNTGGAGVPTLVLCTNVSAHKHGAIAPSSAVPTQDSELTVEVLTLQHGAFPKPGALHNLQVCQKKMDQVPARHGSNTVHSDAQSRNRTPGSQMFQNSDFFKKDFRKMNII